MPSLHCLHLHIKYCFLTPLNFKTSCVCSDFIRATLCLPFHCIIVNNDPCIVESNEHMSFKNIKYINLKFINKQKWQSLGSGWGWLGSQVTSVEILNFHSLRTFPSVSTGLSDSPEWGSEKKNSEWKSKFLLMVDDRALSPVKWAGRSEALVSNQT